MSSGKLRRERSRSRERHSRDESHRRSTPDQRGVPELNEEEYDEEWEHEWEDIDEIGRKNPNYQRPYGRNQKWRGRNQYRGQFRFNKWENKTHPAGSDYGSDGARQAGRRTHAEDEENLEMPPGEEMTNLKVKIQDGKRFAEPDEYEEFESAPEMRNQPRFSRGRGHHRGYHNVGRDKWIPHFRHKRTNDSVDCREFLNRRKRHHPDPSESDLREKLLRKDHELGDLREIIESRETGPSDLRDIIEPPDMSLLDDLGEEMLDEINLGEDINCKIQNEYYDDGVKRRRDYHQANFEEETDRFEHVREEDFTDDIPQEDVLQQRHRTEDWPGEEEWGQSTRRSQERSFCRQEGWHGRRRDHDNEWQGSWGSPKTLLNDPTIRNNHDSSKSRSEERMRFSPSRNLRDRSLERGTRPHELSWEHDRKTDRMPPREGELRMTLREDGERQFSQDRSRTFMADEEHLPGNREQKSRRSPPIERHRKRSIGPGRSESRTRSSSQDTRRTISEKGIGSPERHRRLRSISGERGVGRERIGSVGRESHRRGGDIVNRAGSRDVNPQRSRCVDRRMGRERMRDGERGMFGEGNVDNDRLNIPERQRESDREKVQNRTRNVDRELVPVRGRDGERELIRESNRSGDFSRARSPCLDRNRIPHQERKRSPGTEGARVSRWGPERNPWLPGHEPELIPSREREKTPAWAGPRTPSVERFREAGWASGSSPGRNRARSPVRERSRSRGRVRTGSSDRARDDSRGRRRIGSLDRARDDSRGRQHAVSTDQARDDSRGRPGRAHLKDKDVLRSKETERREKMQDPPRRRDFEQAKDQETRSRGHESGPSSLRHPEKDSGANLKGERIRKREHEDTVIKERAREKPRSPDHRSLQDKTDKKRSHREDFKERYGREVEKPSKFSRPEEFIAKSNRDSLQKGSGGPTQVESREWENIRDYQERRIPESVIGLPFLSEAKRPRENSLHEPLVRGTDSRGSRNLPPPHQGLGLEPSGTRQKKDQPANWFDSKARQPHNRPEEERHRSSRWASPNRRNKPSDHVDSHKSAPHSIQSTPSTHQSSSNGKPDNDFWRRNLPSLGEAQWNKPRSDLTGSSRDTSIHRSSAPYSKPVQAPREVIFLRGLARDIADLEIRKDISTCGLWPKDVRVVYDNETGISRGLAFVTFNSIDEANRWMELRNGVLNLRPNNHVAMEYSNPISKDWECARCHSVNFKHRAACYQCNRAKEDCIDGWEETCPYPTNALLLRGLNPLTSVSELTNALKPRMIAQARLDGVKMGVDAKGRPRSVCFVQLTSVTDSMALHKSLISEPLYIDNHQVMVAYCQLDKLPVPDSFVSHLHPAVPIAPVTMPPAAPLALHSSIQTNNIPVVPRAAPAPPPVKPVVSTAEIRSMLEGHYTEKDIPTLAQYCASAYAKNPQEQAAYVRYYTKLYRDKLMKNQTGGK